MVGITAQFATFLLCHITTTDCGIVQHKHLKLGCSLPTRASLRHIVLSNCKDDVQNFRAKISSACPVSFPVPLVTKGLGVILEMDNVSAVTYMQCQCRTRSHGLLRILTCWQQYTHPTLSTYRQTLIWEYTQQQGSLSTDFHPKWTLFATLQNTKLKHFFLLNLFPGAMGIDAISTRLLFKMAYGFPLTPLIFKFLGRLSQEEVTVLSVVDRSKRETFASSACDFCFHFHCL